MSKHERSTLVPAPLSREAAPFLS
ncbi:MAG: hypothetical protein JWO39_2843, partial [Gemmatimonadetes bacterium]|nr:hypothetical protein [Gemmatimonadota bacterium]